MKYAATLMTGFLLCLTLPGCSLLIKDCSKKIDNPTAYRQCMARQGNQKAQYEMGLLAYEVQDYKTALKWLKLAATPRSGRTAVYLPPVGGQQYGNVMMMDTGDATSGYGAAQSLLANMYAQGIGVKKDAELAQKYRDMMGNSQ